MIVADKSLQDAIGEVCPRHPPPYTMPQFAGLDVVEFQRHSFPISYIEKGLDTTVNLPFPIIDLKIKIQKTVLFISAPFMPVKGVF